ncbi:hypothetical protein JCM10212_000832 [Sporobolomyces blumeae]
MAEQSYPYVRLLEKLRSVVQHVQRTAPEQYAMALEWETDFPEHLEQAAWDNLSIERQFDVLKFLDTGAHHFEVESSQFPSLERLNLSVGFWYTRNVASEHPFLTNMGKKHSFLQKYVEYALASLSSTYVLLLGPGNQGRDGRLNAIRRSIEKLGQTGTTRDLVEWLRSVGGWVEAHWNELTNEGQLELVAGFEALDSLIERCFNGDNPLPRTFFKYYWPSKEKFMQVCGPQVASLYAEYTKKYRARAGRARHAQNELGHFRPRRRSGTDFAFVLERRL